MMINRYRKSRIFNINANIIIASLASIIVAIYPVHLTKMFVSSAILISLISFGIDAVFDLVIFVVLHLCVHRHHVKRFLPSKTILKDIFRIQFHRGVLSGIYFVVAVGTHYFLLMQGIERAIGFVLAYVLALLVTRSLHTFYGLRTGLFERV